MKMSQLMVSSAPPDKVKRITVRLSFGVSDFNRTMLSFVFPRMNPARITKSVKSENKIRKYKISPAGCVLIVRNTSGKNPHTKKAVTADA